MFKIDIVEISKIDLELLLNLSAEKVNDLSLPHYKMFLLKSDIFYFEKEEDNTKVHLRHRHCEQNFLECMSEEFKNKF